MSIEDKDADDDLVVVTVDEAALASAEARQNLRLGVTQMIETKKLIDTTYLAECTTETNPPWAKPFQVHKINVPTNEITALKLKSDNEKLQQIPVTVEPLGIDGKYLVKVGPCDLSGVGGHKVRNEIIQKLVEQALKDEGINKSYEEVNVSACVKVRGQAQMIKGAFKDNREQAGAHHNAYVKTAGETTLTHWEPRNGPQPFYNDSICAYVVCAITSMFEQGIRDKKITSSQQATKSILTAST